MGYVYGKNLKGAGGYVLGLLKEGGAVHYNEHFYANGDEALERRLRVAFGFKADDESHPPAILVDLAVGQLEQKGLVETTQLPELMGDGEPDYEIRLTEHGRAFLATGQEFVYRDLDL